MIIWHNIKQAWVLIKQNKLYSSIYIIGTGLAIAMAMIMAIIYYIKIAPLYPENNRSRTLVFTRMMLTYPDSDRRTTSNLSHSLVKEHFYTLQSPEAVTGILTIRNDRPLVKQQGGKLNMPTTVGYVDNDFWKVFTFKFLSGKPFSKEDFESGIKTAVISASMANKLFGTIEAEGLRMTLDNNEYRIAGVVKDVSYATPVTYAEIWVPYTVKPEELKPLNMGEGYMGRMKVYILAPSVAAMDDVKNEVETVFHNINSSQDRYKVHINGQPDPYWRSVFRIYSSRDVDWGKIFKTLGIMLIAMLLIPAMNLAGMVSSRMEKRLPEMGLRKVFGASRGKLYSQILTENFLLTLLGGLAGLFISYFIIYARKDIILTLFDKWPNALPDGINNFFTIDMLINPVVFLITFGICLLLNFVSAIVPAWHALKKDIVYSLNKEN